MTIEQKDKQYDDALERARTYLKGHTLDVNPRAAMEYVFPELKENDDERIMKNCIHFLELQKEHHAATFEIEECIEWLKSLKSQNKYDKGYNDGYSAAKYNQWKPSKEQLKVLQTAIRDYGICYEKHVLESLYNDLKPLNHD